jgi:hypothetical protein
MTRASRRKSGVASSAAVQTASSSSELATERQAYLGGPASAETVVPSARMHNDMKRNEVHSASRKPPLSHSRLADERAQRSTSPASTCDPIGSTPRSTSSIGALRSKGSQRLTSAMEMPTKGTSDIARK